KITVTDGKGGKVVHGYALPVVTPLTSGTPVSIAGEADSFGFATINVPAGVPVLQVTLRGGSGGADLGVVSPCGGSGITGRTGNTETLSFANPVTGEWQVAVTGFHDYSAVALTASFVTPTALNPTSKLSGLMGVTGSETFYRISVPPGATFLTITTSGGAG